MEHRRYSQAPEIPIYLIPHPDFVGWESWHCSHCGMWLGDVKGRMVKIESSPPVIDKALVGVGTLCRRCKQRYRFVLIGIDEYMILTDI